MKLVKLLANLGYGSRKEVQRLIRSGAVTAADIQEDASYQVINPDQHICTLDRKVKFEMDLEIRVGRGFATGAFEIHFPKRFTRLLRVLRLLPYRLYFPLIRRFTGA